MPPRYTYWTIILDGRPTAFRAADRESLLPTLKQLQSKNPDAVLKWFARGKVWESPEDAQSHERRGGRARHTHGDRPGPHPASDAGHGTGAPRGEGESRGKGWRPGGEHKDPREKFKKETFQARKRREKKAAQAERDRNRFDSRGGSAPKPAWNQRPKAGAGPRQESGGSRNEGPRDDKRRAGPPKSGEAGGRPHSHGAGAKRPWDNRGPKRPWENRDAKRPWEDRGSNAGPRGDKRTPGPQTRNEAGGRPQTHGGGAKRPWDNRGPKRPWENRDAKRPWEDRGSNAAPRGDKRTPGPQTRNEAGGRPQAHGGGTKRPWENRGPKREWENRDAKRPSDDRGTTPPGKRSWEDRGGERPYRKPAREHVRNQTEQRPERGPNEPLPVVTDPTSPPEPQRTPAPYEEERRPTRPRPPAESIRVPPAPPEQGTPPGDSGGTAPPHKTKMPRLRK